MLIVNCFVDFILKDFDRFQLNEILSCSMHLKHNRMCPPPSPLNDIQRVTLKSIWLALGIGNVEMLLLCIGENITFVACSRLLLKERMKNNDDDDDDYEKSPYDFCIILAFQ